jgi:threonine synthase
MDSYKGLIERYRKYLPVSDNTPVVSLLEGNTPLIPAPRISEALGKNIKVYLKYEGLNPTGSFKDRGMTMAISKAKEEGVRAVICASTGNTSASAAAYSARAGLTCVVIIPAGNIALGKLAQSMIHGARVVAIKGNFDDALRLVRELAADFPVQVVNSINPYRIEGQKTAAFEICDRLGYAPHFHALPVGNAGNITAYWKGYKEYYSGWKTTHLPKMLGFQAAGSAPIVKGRPIKKPHTIATAIKIGNPASWQEACTARDESGGLIDCVTDAEILAAYKLLASREGVFCEPASSASVAGILKLKDQGFWKALAGREITVVCTLTGHGLKDPDCVIKNIKNPPEVAADIKAVAKAAGLK